MTQPPQEWLPNPDGAGVHQYWVDQSQVPQPPRKSWKSDPRKVWLVVAAAVLVVVVAFAAVLVGVSDSGTTEHRPQQQANSGPLTGVYSAEFGPEIGIGTTIVLNPLGAHDTLEIRSTCTSTGCTAIAKSASGPLLNRTLIFDQIKDHWVAVGVAASTTPAISVGLNADCEQGLSPETWEALSLQTQPDGRLSGQYEVTNANNCNATRTVSLKRTGDVAIDTIDDPARLTPRTPSPAQGFRGRYRYTYRSSPVSSHDVEGAVETRCLHSGDRCMSYFYEPNSAEPFIFSRGQWTLAYNAPVSCERADGPRVRINRNAVLALPQSPSDPIQTLTGQGQEEVTGVLCRHPASTYYLQFERIGD